jgi:hypothetical protein
MYVLTPENTALDIERIPDKIDEDIRYSVLDLTNSKNYDFYFFPLVYLESFNAPAIVLQIGNRYVKMPCIESPNDWKILIGDPEIGQLEAVSLEDLNSRDFQAFSFNPISSFMPKYLPIRIVDTFIDMRWYMPTLPTNYVLTVPIDNSDKPECVFFVNGITGRKVDVIDVGDIF